MIENLTPDRIANAILLDSSYKGLYVLVEGNKDSKLFSKFFSLETLRVRTTFGCKKMIEVFNILNSRGFDRKIGIIDRDFYNILGNEPKIENIFITDFHDIEVMIIMTKAFEDVLRIYTIQEKVEEFEKKHGKSIREIIFELSDNIGYLKLVEKVNDFGLVFKPKQPDGNQIKYNDFISDKLEYKGDKELVKSIVNYSRNRTIKKLDETAISVKLSDTKKIKIDSLQLSNGHDLSNIVFIFLKKTVRSTNKMLFDNNSIEDSLILAYDFEDFKKTELYKKLIEYSKQNDIQLFRQN